MALLGAGCGGGQESSDQSATVESDSPPAVLSAQVEPRKIVYTADVTVRVDAVGRATTDAVRIASEAGGLVFSQSSDGDNKEARLTLKVPPESFKSVLADLAELGRALESDIKAEDITEEVTDVDGRLKTSQASADRLRTLLGAASSTTDIVAIEGELAKREGEIESLQGRLRVLTNQVEMTTINLRLTETADLEVNREVPGFLKALRTGWVALLNVLLGVVAVAGFILPFAPLVVLGWWIVRRYRSHHPRRHRPWPPSYPPPGASPWPGGGPGEGSESSQEEPTMATAP